MSDNNLPHNAGPPLAGTYPGLRVMASPGVAMPIVRVATQTVSNVGNTPIGLTSATSSGNAISSSSSIHFPDNSEIGLITSSVSSQPGFNRIGLPDRSIAFENGAFLPLSGHAGPNSFSHKSLPYPISQYAQIIEGKHQQTMNVGWAGVPPLSCSGTFMQVEQSPSISTQFQTLTLGSYSQGHQIDVGIDPSLFPRPCGCDPDAVSAAPEVQNKSNCNSKFMRMTCNAIPNSSQLRGRWSMPLGVLVHPLAGDPGDVPVVCPDSAGIVRCRRCRTYINPFVQWSDGGRRFRCNICGMMNEVPVEYFCTLDSDGRRRDESERPELAKGSAEYVAPAEYMVRPPMPPVFFFVIDVSRGAVSSGMLRIACETIKTNLNQLPGGSRTQVGFMTFDSVLHFYNLKSTLSQPQQMVVADIDDPFIPIPDDLLVNLVDSFTVVEALLDSLPSIFEGSTQEDSCMGPALKAAFLIQSHIGGKMLLFQAAVPNIGSGKIKNRDIAALYGTDREHLIRIPEDSFFKKFSAECSRAQITVDLFSFSSLFCDLASLCSLSKYTCGQVYYYPGFNSDRDRSKFEAELRMNLSRLTGWEAVMRIRCSKGLKISSFHGHFFIRSTDLLAMPTIDPDKCFAVQISHEDAIVTGSTAYVQCALLYTASCGERRIRVHTMSVPIVSDLNEMFKAVDCGALVCMLGKLGVEKTYSSRLDDTRQALQLKVTHMLKEFRVLNAGHFRAPNKMILPDRAQLLPVLTLGLMKVSALRGGVKDVNTDERIAVGFEIMASSVQHISKLAYPNLYPVHDMSGDWGIMKHGFVSIPPTIPLSMEMLSGDGAYLMDNGRIFILWLGRNISSSYIGQLFCTDPSSLAQDLIGATVEPEKPTEVSRRICCLLAYLRKDNWIFQQCFVVRQGSAMEAHVLPYFIEDRGQGTASYSDFLCSLHKSITTGK